MAGLVLDASVTLSWAHPDETRASEAHALVLRVADEAAVVPALWRLEVGNALIVSERRNRVVRDRVDAVWRMLDAMPIAVDPETNARAWNATAALARQHGLTLYDAAYLELALRRHLPLATFDAVLARAAAAEGIAVASGEP